MTATYRIRSTGSPTVSAARGFSPTERSRRPQRVRNRKKVSAGTSASPIQVIRFASPNAAPKNPTCWISGILTLGTIEMFSGVPLFP